MSAVSFKLWSIFELIMVITSPNGMKILASTSFSEDIPLKKTFLVLDSNVRNKRVLYKVY